jgi:hypothetical protein
MKWSYSNTRRNKTIAVTIVFVLAGIAIAIGVYSYAINYTLPIN